MQSPNTFRAFGYSVHLAQPNGQHRSAVCGRTDAVISISAQDLTNLPMSAICPQCRRMLDRVQPGPARN